MIVMAERETVLVSILRGAESVGVFVGAYTCLDSASELAAFLGFGSVLWITDDDGAAWRGQTPHRDQLATPKRSG